MELPPIRRSLRLPRFFLAMALNLTAQTKAQDEIDRVVGHGRLPDFPDQGSLPYVSAVLKETLRWHSPTPQGLAHLQTKDDVYNNFHLPKGSMVMGNIWEILHDPLVYDEPMKFKPERFLRDGKLECITNDPSRAAFGFGRRSCPGRALAEQSLWLAFAQVLAMYSIRPLDESLRAKFTSGSISHPMPFKCSILPRSSHSVILLENLDATILPEN